MYFLETFIYSFSREVTEGKGFDVLCFAMLHLHFLKHNFLKPWIRYAFL